MADLNQKLREVWKKGMEAIGSTANGIASSARYKVDEMNLTNRRREIMKNLATVCYELYKRGETFPEEAEAMLREISQVDQEMEALHQNHMEPKQPEETPDNAQQQTAEVTVEDVPEAPAAEETVEAAQEAETTIEEAETTQAVNETIADEPNNEE